MSSGESCARYFSVETRDPPRYANRPNLARGGRRAQHASRFGGETLTRGGEREPCDVSTRAHLRSSIRSPRSSVRPVICGDPRRNTRTRFVFGFGITATVGLVAHRLMSNQSRPEGRNTRVRGQRGSGWVRERREAYLRRGSLCGARRGSPRERRRHAVHTSSRRGGMERPRRSRVKRASPGPNWVWRFAGDEIKPSILCEVS